MINVYNCKISMASKSQFHHENRQQKAKPSYSIRLKMLDKQFQNHRCDKFKIFNFKIKLKNDSINF